MDSWALQVWTSLFLKSAAAAPCPTAMTNGVAVEVLLSLKIAMKGALIRTRYQLVHHLNYAVFNNGSAYSLYII